VEQEFNRVINTPTGLVYAVLSDWNMDFMNKCLCDYASLPQAPERKTGDSSLGENRAPNSTDPQLHEEAVKSKRLVISVVDDDESIRESLPDLLREFGYAAQAFSSGEEFLASEYLAKTSCVILDVAMPGMTGPDLQHELAVRQQRIPIIFITAQRDEAIRPRLLKLGAVECLLKPFSEAALLEAINVAFQGNV
jgi:CheY-like chemotaxis protein